MEKEGLLKNGKLDQDKINAMFVKTGEDHPDGKNVTDRIRANCLGGEYKKYPPIDCESMQFHVCIYMTALVVSMTK